MLLLISTEPKAFPHVAPRPPIHSEHTVTRGPSLKETLLVAFFVSSAISIAHSVITGKQQWALERQNQLHQYAPADGQFDSLNSTTSESFANYDDYEQNVMESEEEDSNYNENLQKPEDHSSDEGQERTVVFNTTYTVGQPYLKPKHETLAIGETPLLATHNCIDGVCGPRKAKVQKEANIEELPGNPNGAGEHIMPSIKRDAEKLPSEIAAEYLRKVKDYVKQLKTSTPRQSYQLRRKYAQTRRQMWDEFNRARKEAEEQSTTIPTESM